MRQRGELVPVGEVVSGQDDGLVLAIREATPQARHCFTVADQVNQLVSARFAGPDKSVYLIGKGETPLRRSITAERFDGAGQIGQGFGNGNQLAALTPHGFILPCTSDKAGTPPPSIPEKSSLEPAPPARS